MVVMRAVRSPVWIEGEWYAEWVLLVPLSGITDLVCGQGRCSLGNLVVLKSFKISSLALSM